MSRSQRAGKLGAALYGAPVVTDNPADTQTPRLVRTDLIDVMDGFNPRRFLTDDALSAAALGDLADSIRAQGILQPLVVRRAGARYQLIAGERRLRASALAGLRDVPVVVVDADDLKALEIAIVENAQRQDLDVVTETFAGFDFLSRHLGMSVEDVVTYLNAVRKGRREDERDVEGLLRRLYGTGISVWSQRRASILRMTPEERSAVIRKLTDVAVCAELTGVKDASYRAALLQRAITQQLSAPQVRLLVREREVAATGLPARVADFKKHLPKLARLDGARARKAEKLLEQLEQLLQE
ncbi:ParB/RepB/Spo0J family partition protein [Deinococcus pimensis]|uniref:ParB/RepB/Spo0J family partition protein n=1 Tax=Deinococcus pimensis TaxID=309888 RepID=UPI00047FC474|nr:ParB/RepB/Spo0J family partition protein [Deinococcus pimensis]